MKDVPFYPNHGDDMHCMLAVYSSIIEFFLNKKLSWTELEKLVGFKDGKAAWTVEALPKMSRMGLNIKMIEPFDYSRYLKDGEAYLNELYSAEEIDWYYKNSNIKEMKKYIPKFANSRSYVA